MPENNFKKKSFFVSFLNYPFGNISIASLIIAILSGVLLAITFNVQNPLDSISYWLLADPASTLLRNIHYWAAQLFLVATILHIVDHLHRGTEKDVKNGIWFRLTLSLFFIFYVMISGFLLKGDSDSVQAGRIIRTLFEQIPLIGNILTYSLFGSGGNYQIIYVNHIATATIILIFVWIEHSRQLYPKVSVFVYTFVVIFIISLFFSANLHDGKNTIVKGPWYFLGLQEILHWVSEPIYVVVFAFFLLVIFYLLKFAHQKTDKAIKYILLCLGLLYIILIFIGAFFRGENWKYVLPWKSDNGLRINYLPIFSFAEVDTLKIYSVLGRNEGCLSCHNNVKGFESSHLPEAIGCYSCHLGNPYTLNKDYAHSDMIFIPGNLSDANNTCGTSDCHPDIVPRVDNSIMNTLSGMISVNRFVFDELKEPKGLFKAQDLNQSNADNHLRNLCASCHIGNVKTEYGPITERSRGGGCNACHLNYSTEALKQLINYEKFVKYKTHNINIPNIHPNLNLDISDEHCFGCHSRSGRISTNYEGWSEIFSFEDEIKSLRQINNSEPNLSSQKTIVDINSNYRVLMDGRVFKKQPADVHHNKGMDCIDCHIAQEIMGDGNLYEHKEEQVKIQCTDCHSYQSKTISYNNLDYESRKIVDLQKSQRDNNKFLLIQEFNLPLINSYQNNKGYKYLITQIKKDSLQLKPPASICIEGKAHERLSCNSCHTQWVSYCAGCHTEYQPDGKGYDLLVNKEINGRWVETSSDFYVDYPTLGVKKEKSGKEIIDTFIPGMIITIDNMKNEKDKKIFKRLFAPTVAHTINKDGRSCKSCHNNSLAIGYGKGKLSYKIFDTETNPQTKLNSNYDLSANENKNVANHKEPRRSDKSNIFGKWSFKPQFAIRREDNLPKDAWIGFMQNTNENSTTRINTRPFNVDEQKRILLVGACLTCHAENSNVMQESLIDFETVLKKISKKCVLPE